MSVYFDKTLHHMGRNKFIPSILVIGAMDGISFDDMSGYISMYGWSGLFVEPIEYQFGKLKQYYDSLNYKHSNIYENCAISDYDGEIKMMVIDQEVIDSKLVHPCFGGMSAVYPPRNGLGSEGDAKTVEQYSKIVSVPCKTLKTVLTKHDIHHIDIIQVDAEGHDWKILRQLDFSRYRPKLIRSEIINLTEDEQAEIKTFFTELGYDHILYGQDIDFVDKYFWKTIEGA